MVNFTYIKYWLKRPNSVIHNLLIRAWVGSIRGKNANVSRDTASLKEKSYLATYSNIKKIFAWMDNLFNLYNIHQ